MRRSLTLVFFAMAAAPVVCAQTPVITDVLNAADYTPALAQGTVFVVNGSNLCTTSSQATLPYQTAALAGVTIQLFPSTGGTPVLAYMIYTACDHGVTQLGALLPSNTSIQNYNVAVTNNGLTSGQFPVTVVASRFAIMTLAGTGEGRGLVQNVVSLNQYDVNGFTTGPISAGLRRSPATPGEYLIIWGTGLGGARGYDSTPPPNGFDFLAQGLRVQVLVGGVFAVPIYAGRSNLYPGLDNIVFQLPANVATGCDVPIQVQLGGSGVGPGSGGIFSNIATIAIAPAAGAAACVSPPFSPAVLARLDQGGVATIGAFSLQGTGKQGGLNGGFSKISADQVGIASLFYTPAGSCRVASSSESMPEFPRGLGLLDAGAISVRGSGLGIQPLTQGSGNIYDYQWTPFPVSPGQSYAISGAGGGDIGPFTATAVLDSPITITAGLPPLQDPPAAFPIPRSRDLTITWTGGGTDLVQVIGAASAPVPPTPSVIDTEVFVCTTTADKGTITIPQSVLSRLPATPVTNANEANHLFVISRSSSGNGVFTAPLAAGGNVDVALFFAALVAGGGPATYQ